MIASLRGDPASALALAAYPGQDPGCIPQALAAGVNFFFFYGPGHKSFVDGLRPLVRAHRDEIILASGSGARQRKGLRTARRKLFAAVGADMLDVFFAEYLHPGDDFDVVFGEGGVLDELQGWKAEGGIRAVGASAHDRTLAKKLAADSRVDLLMHRFNMAHRKATSEVFPTAVETKTPVVAFTATRWGTLLEGRPDWPDAPPSAADCYRFCLAEQAVRLVLTAPKSIAQLDENLAALKAPPMSEQERRHWQRYGDIVYGRKRGADTFESRWP